MNIKSQLKTETKLITGKVRFSYAHVFEPYGEGENKKYSVSLLIPKSDDLTISNIKKAIENANAIGESKTFEGKKVVNIYAILRDGDVEKPEDENYKGHYFINANSRTKPQVIDIRKKAIEDETEFYSGCYGVASVNFYPYNFNGKRGIACGLNNLLKLEDGGRLGSVSTAFEDFSDFEFDAEELGDLI